MTDSGPDKLSDHDLLLRIDERTRQMDKRLQEHLTRHWVVLAAAITACMGAVSSVIVAWGR